MNLPSLALRLLLGRRLPITSGTLPVPGVRGPVLVHRDANGIPHVEAQDDSDAWYGLGFCQWQDRAFQLETLLRVTRGSLSEIAGPKTLPIDRIARRMGFAHGAAHQLDSLAPDVLAGVEVFARGITESSTLGARRRAHEFALLRTRPTPWTAEDVIAVSRFRAFTLASNWDVELARLLIAREDGIDALRALDPAYPDTHPVSVPPGVAAGPAVDRLAEDLGLFAATVGAGGASNGWPVAPSRTATGRPLLANDPHFPPTLPPHWYLAHLRTPNWSVAGATLPGTPAFAVGHNGFAAWEAVAGMVDNTDLFLEDVGADGASVREEKIAVKDGPDIVERVLVTQRGPVIGPALEGANPAVSIKAVWLGDGPIRGLLSVHRARSFDELREAFNDWPLMSLNLIYADASGTIASQLVGETPVRRRGWGTIPAPGWEPEVGWEERGVAFEKMPHAARPGGRLRGRRQQRAGG